MSIPWGPALDAEVAYRHQQARTTFHRQSARSASRQRRAATRASTPRISTQVGRGMFAGTPKVA
jgi:hypothetical protein